MPAFAVLLLALLQDGSPAQVRSWQADRFAERAFDCGLVLREAPSDRPAVRALRCERLERDGEDLRRAYPDAALARTVDEALGRWREALRAARSRPAEAVRRRERDCFVERMEMCGHFAGEEPYNRERAWELARALKGLRCDRLDADGHRLRRRHADAETDRAVDGVVDPPA